MQLLCEQRLQSVQPQGVWSSLGSLSLAVAKAGIPAPWASNPKHNTTVLDIIGHVLFFRCFPAITTVWTYWKNKPRKQTQTKMIESICVFTLSFPLNTMPHKILIWTSFPFPGHLCARCLSIIYMSHSIKLLRFPSLENNCKLGEYFDHSSTAMNVPKLCT
jgi:hypothetical protein